MGVDIALTVETAEYAAELNDSPVATALAESLPTESRMSRWGDEYYGPIGLKMPNDADARDVVEVGTLAYWPAGDSLCIFFGPTPVSVSDEPRAASEVTVLGRIKGSTDSLRSLGSSVAVRIRRA